MLKTILGPLLAIVLADFDNQPGVTERQARAGDIQTGALTRRGSWFCVFGAALPRFGSLSAFTG
ncbi:MAG: hypothetical protein IPM39_25775 [Chloroflexi bacterium]|nr:hypothetical protein [Chloroflexota bacterium]